MATLTTATPVAFDQLVQQMSDQYQAALDTTRPVTADDVTEGSILRSIFEAVAAPLEDLNFEIAVLLPAKLYLDQATGSDLDKLVSDFTFGQVVRVPASTAAGPILYEGIPNAGVALNAQLKSPVGTVVNNLAAVIIPLAASSVLGAGQAVLAGSAGNLVGGTELAFLAAQAGITRASVPTNWSGGLDQQSDESLRQAVIDFLDSLSKATRPALLFGAIANGYDRVVIIEPNTGRVDMYLDDGNPVSLVKLAAARSNLHLNWIAAGAKLRVFGPSDHPFTVAAEAFTDGSVTKAQLQAAIEVVWTQKFGPNALRMGTRVARLDLVAAAAQVPGYNGVNIFTPDHDLVLRAPLDDYWTEWSDGDLYPYERPVYTGATWT